jgi:ankyrin repeat protein
MELIEAVRENNLDSVNRLLLNPRIKVDQDENEDTPLLVAAETGNVDIGLRLIQAGANINQRNYNGETPLMVAVLKENKDFVILLLEQQTIAVDIPEKHQGKTPL